MQGNAIETDKKGKEKKNEDARWKEKISEQASTTPDIKANKQSTGGPARTVNKCFYN